MTAHDADLRGASPEAAPSEAAPSGAAPTGAASIGAAPAEFAPTARPPAEGTPLVPASSIDHPLHESVVEACRGVFDPEIPVNIYDLGLVYAIEVSPDSDVRVLMTLTAPGCPVAGEMPGWVAEAIEPLPGVRTVDVRLTFDPPWGMEMMSDEARLELGFM